MRNRIFIGISILTALLVSGSRATAQVSPTRLMMRADSARMAYDFKASADFCQRAIDALDSTAAGRAEERLLLARNGLNMMDFCSSPAVVSRQTFPLKDFFLFYPLADLSWRRVPNQLDSSAADKIPSAVYFPEDAGAIYWSAKDGDGIRNIYRTERTDSLWTAPALINEHLTSSSDEIFPMLSPDGQSLYFASKGLYGMGGYDLYVSQWNDETGDWGVPVNMGFPYSSPYDDFLFINTDDGRYSIFASNRSCGRDSVTIYVLEYDGMPVREAITDVARLRELSELAPAGSPARMDNGSAVQSETRVDEATAGYMQKMKEVRMLRDSVARFGKHLDELRSSLASAPEGEKGGISARIAEGEASIPTLNAALNSAVKELQDIEMDFLANGIVIDAAKLQAEADKEVVGASTGYTFSKNSYGPSFSLEMSKPKKDFDYSFRILPEGRFAEDNTLPDGLVYQIRIFTLSRDASVADLNGLSPVFVRTLPSGKKAYSVGLFRSYKDVLEHLNAVKKRGFRDAQIDAAFNGQVIGVQKARTMESQVTALYTVKIFPEDGQSLPEAAVAAIRQHSDKDLIRSVEDGSAVFLAGPFEGEDQAEALAAALKTLGLQNVSVTRSSAE